jgi:hypothetical protein
MVSLIVEMPEDRSVEVGTVGSAVGVTAGLGSGIGSVSALVQVSGTSLCIPASRFRAAAAKSQRIRDMIIRYAELQLGQIEQTAACNALHDIASRMSRWLLQTSDKIEDRAPPLDSATGRSCERKLSEAKPGDGIWAARSFLGFAALNPRLRSTTRPSRSYAAPAPGAGAAGR